MTDPGRSLLQLLNFTGIDMNCMDDQRMRSQDAVLIKPIYCSQTAFLQAVIFVNRMLRNMDMKTNIIRAGCTAGVQSIFGEG